MMPTMEHVLKHYREEAEKCGASKQSTMKDIHVRDMEVAKIIECLLHFKDCFEEPYCILEVGCGNGYAAEKLEKLNEPILVNGIDVCREMIEIANKRCLDMARFEVGDVTALRFIDERFNIVFSERCLINLASWKRQKKALDEIYRILVPGGIFIMVEAFTDGLDDLNRARDAVGLPPIPMPSFDYYLDKARLFRHIVSKFKDLEWCPPNFLSTYYFGTRVIYPALIRGRKEVLNSLFDEFWTYLPPYGNYSPIQMYVLQKV